MPFAAMAAAHRAAAASAQQGNGMPAAAVAALRKALSSGAAALTGMRLQEWPAGVFDSALVVNGEEDKWWEVAPLVKLDLSNNALVDVPDAVEGLADLSVLIAQHNAIATVSPAIGALASLTVLDLSQ